MIGQVPPPAYEEVVSREKAELECLQELPSYGEAVRREADKMEHKVKPNTVPLA